MGLRRLVEDRRSLLCLFGAAALAAAALLISRSARVAEPAAVNHAAPSTPIADPASSTFRISSRWQLATTSWNVGENEADAEAGIEPQPEPIDAEQAELARRYAGLDLAVAR